MIDFNEILWGIILPPILMAIGMLATAYLPASKRFLSTGALLALVFGICQLAFRHWPLPGGDVHNWPAWTAFAGGLTTLCSACGHGPLLWQVTVRLAITGSATWLMLRSEFMNAGIGAAFGWVGGTALVWTALVLVWERAHARTTQGVSVAVLATLAGVSSLSLLLFNTLTHAQFAGIITAALCAAAVLSWLRPVWYAPAGVVTVTALALPSLWLLGTFMVLKGLPWWSLPLLGLAGLAPLVIALAPFQTWSAWKRILVSILVTVVLVSPVVVLGIITSIEASKQPSYGY